MGFEHLEKACYCGGDLRIPFVLHHLQNISSCSKCNRLYIENEDTTWTLLIPWKGFKDRGSEECARCGGKTNYSTRTLRHTCKEPLCGYGWRLKTQTKSMVETQKTQQWKDILAAMQEAEDKDLMSMATQIEILKQEVRDLREDKL